MGRLVMKSNFNNLAVLAHLQTFKIFYFCVEKPIKYNLINVTDVRHSFCTAIINRTNHPENLKFLLIRGGAVLDDNF